MQNWEEQRELFLAKLKSAQQKPPARPRIRPNLFARLARYCIAEFMPVLLFTAFFITAASTLAVLGTRFDFTRPIAIELDPKTQSAQSRYQTEFPTVASLMIVRVSADNTNLAQTATQFVAKRLEAKKTNISHVFTPGLGPYYDRFGILYVQQAEISARVERAKRLKPLFQAIAASPNLAGLSTLVNQIVQAVQKGRSPQGLETLFLQMSSTIKKQVANKPEPLDWRRVAGLRIENKSKDWVVVVQPTEGRSQGARLDIETLTASVLKSQPALKITNEFPPEVKSNDSGSSGRQIVISVLLSILFFLPLVLMSLRNTRSIVLFTAPPLAALVAAFATASFVAPVLDQAIATLAFATLLPVMGFSICLVTALRKSVETGSSTSLIMLAAHEMGPLVSALAGMMCATWLLWTIMGLDSISRLSVIVIFACLAGLAATLLLVPALAFLLPRPQDEPPADWYDQTTAQNIRAIWHRLRPPLTVLLMAASLFCIVFFSSLNFSASRLYNSTEDTSSASRGVQFIVEGETAAAKLVGDLQQIPEVGTVRWMGIFLPQEVEQKRKILQGLAGTMPGVNDGSSIGPYDLIENLRGLETGLRIIADEARTDEGLRASANEFRRTLAVLTNTSKTPELTAVELERLLFSGFGELAKAADGLSRLTAPQLSDFDPNLRALYVSDGDKWRVEALPKRVITAKAFIDATNVVDDLPLGPLMVEQAELRTLESASKTALVFGFLFTLLIALAYLRNILDWLIVVISSLSLLPLYAAFVVTTATAISPVTIPALVMASLFGVTTAMLLVAKKWKPQITALTILLPAAAIVAIVLPTRLLHVQEFEAFTSTLTMLLVAATIFNLTVVPQICAWTDGWRSSRPRLNEAGVAPQPREDLDDDVF